MAHIKIDKKIAKYRVLKPEAKDAAGRLKSELEQSRERLVAARESLRDYKASHGVFLYKEEYDAKLRVISDLTVELAKLDQSLAGGTFDAKTYEKKRANLIKILEEKRAELAPLPMVEREVQLRQSDIDVANTTYEVVAKEMKNAEIKSDSLSEARLISAAFVPQTPGRMHSSTFGGRNTNQRLCRPRGRRWNAGVTGWHRCDSSAGRKKFIRSWKRG